MELAEFVKQVKQFKSFQLSDKVIVMGFWLHDHKKQEWFKSTDINACFARLHFDKPANATSLMNGMTGGSVKRLIRTTRGFKLNSGARERVEKLLPVVQTPKQIIATLKALEAQITDPQQKVFLHEALTCFAYEAHRASIVMAWNLAYHHVLTFVFNHKLAEFNAQAKTQFPKDTLVVRAFSDFEELREGKVLMIVKNAGIVSAATSKTLKAKLDIRNTAAHPSSTIVSPITAEEVLTDLVKNILLRPVL